MSNLSFAYLTIVFKVGQLSTDAFNQYEMKLQKENATIRIKCWVVQVQPITKSLSLFESEGRC